MSDSHRICRYGCEMYGRYRPDEDTVRWCPRCEEWYHVDCLEVEREALAPTLERSWRARPQQPDLPLSVDDVDFMPGHKFTKYEYAIWCNLLNQPLERHPSRDNRPLTFEMVLHKVRKTDRGSGCPPNVRGWLAAALGMVDDRKGEVQRFLGMLIHMEYEPWLYRCANCEYIV